MASVEEEVGKKQVKNRKKSKKKAQEYEDEYIFNFTNFTVQMHAYASLTKTSDQTAKVKVAFTIREVNMVSFDIQFKLSNESVMPLWKT